MLSKLKFIFFIFASLLTVNNIEGQNFSDSVRISEYLHIERTDEKGWIERYKGDINRYIDENRQLDDPSCDVLFLGSSSINMWNNIHNDMAPLKVIRRSYGGASVRDMLYNYDVIARGFKPKCIVMYSENDICPYKECIREDETFDLFRIFAQRIRRDYLGVPFYIISIKPSFSRKELLEQQNIINYLLKCYTERTSDVYYIDVASAMYDEHHNLRQDIFLEDGLHLNQKGYDIWTSVIKPLIIKHREE